MMQTPEKQAPNELDQLSLTELKEQLDAVQSRLDKLNDYDELQDDEFNARAAALTDQYIATSPDGTKEEEATLAALRDAGSGQLREFIEANFDSILKDIELADKLSANLDERIEEEYQKAYDKFSKQTDWNKVVNDRVNTSQGASVALDFAQLSHLLSNKPHPSSGHARLTPAIEELQSINEVFEAQGYKLEQPAEEAPFDEQDAFNFKKFKGMVSEHVEQMFEASRYMGELRRNTLVDHVTNPATEAHLDRITEVVKQCDVWTPEGYSTHPALAKAIKNVVQASFEDIDKSDEAFIRQEMETRPTAPLISGVNALKGIFGESAAEQTYKYLNRFPAHLIKGLGFIKFTPRQVTLAEEDRVHPGFDKLKGLTSATENSVEVYTEQELLDGILAHQDGRFTVESAQQMVADRVMHTFMHELAHYAHLQVIPLEWLRSWVDVTKEEQVFITDYAKHSHHKDTGKERFSAGAEDLADSIAIYLNNPSKLLDQAPKRFMLIDDLFKVYQDSFITAILTEENPHKKALLKMQLVPPDEQSQALQRMEDLIYQLQEEQNQAS